MGGWARVAAVLTACVSLCAACSSSTGGARVVGSSAAGSSTTIGASTTNPHPAGVHVPPVPAPPTAAAAPSGDAKAQAAALAAATGPGADSALAAWLTVYQLAKIPVLSNTGAALDGSGDDPLGPAWWQLWMASDSAHRGITLADVLKTVIAPDDRAPTDAEATAAATAFVEDLRKGLASASPTAEFVAAFIDAKAQQAGTSASIADPTFDVAATTVDLSTSQFVTWVALRGEADALAGTAPGSSGFAAPRHQLRTVPGTTPCSQLWGDEQTTFIINWIANKLGGGVPIGSLEVPSLVTSLSRIEPGLLSAETAAKVNKLAAQANALASILSALMLYSAIDVAGSADTLDRTNGTSDGHSLRVPFRIFLNPDKLPDGNDPAMCALSFLLNALGIGLQFPAGGGLGEVDVLFTGKDGFGTRVLFENQAQIRQTADTDGNVVLDLIGKGQRRPIPASNPRLDKEYTLNVSATPEPVNGNSIFNTFFDSITFAGAPNPLAAVAVILDILKTMHWDLGDQVLPMKDWVTGWKIDRGSGQSHVVGQHCGGAEGTWTADGTYTGGLGAQGTQKWTIPIDATGKAGTFTYTAVQKMTVSGIDVFTTGNAAGNVTLNMDQDGQVTIHFAETSHKFESTTSAGGQGHDVDAPLESYDQVWDVDPTCD